MWFFFKKLISTSQTLFKSFISNEIQNRLHYNSMSNVIIYSLLQKTILTKSTIIIILLFI